ncbi:MAG: IS256 family transposase [Candidatus Eisenbacteria bacterium]|nr:IS256 family transposase [Candidatus Eisenbacteria bacterium]
MSSSRVLESDADVKDLLEADGMPRKELNQEVFLSGLGQYLRNFLREAFKTVIRNELTVFLGRGPYERSEEDKGNYRNGSYRRSLDTEFGELKEIEVARDRDGEFEPEVLDRYRRRQKKIDRAVIALFVGGISTRRVKKVMKMLIGKGYSAGTVSNINKQLTEEMKKWLESPLADDVRYIFLDGLNLPVRRFTVSKESLLMAIGVTVAGHRKVLGVQLGSRESAASWREFLKGLKARGLCGKELRLGVMDGLAGLETAFEEAYPRAKTQRCVVHKLRNVAAKLPRSIQKKCLDGLKRVFHAASEAKARVNWLRWKAKWEKIAPGAVGCVEKDLEALLSFYQFPKSQWAGLRTTNRIERAFKEFRRRTRAMDSFPNEECCLRCVYALSKELDERWEERRLCGFSTMKPTAETAKPRCVVANEEERKVPA